MKPRLMGPWRGWYVWVVALPHGPLGERFLGSFQVLGAPGLQPQAAPAAASGECPEDHPTRTAALEAAETLAFAALARLPDGPCVIDALAHPLVALGYVSRVRVGLDAFALGHILSRARARNAHYGVTGMLLLFDDTFMQYLEGPAPHVELAYHMVRKDPRHGGWIETLRTPIAQRVFGDWSMAFDSPQAASLMGAEARPLLATSVPGELAAKVPLALFLQRATS